MLIFISRYVGLAWLPVCSQSDFGSDSTCALILPCHKVMPHGMYRWSLLLRRGQVIRVKAPWIKHYMNNNGQFYIIPNFETVVLGGTTQRGNDDTTISQEVIAVSGHKVLLLFPGMKHASSPVLRVDC